MLVVLISTMSCKVGFSEEASAEKRKFIMMDIAKKDFLSFPEGYYEGREYYPLDFSHLKQKLSGNPEALIEIEKTEELYSTAKIWFFGNLVGLGIELSTFFFIDYSAPNDFSKNVTAIALLFTGAGIGLTSSLIARFYIDEGKKHLTEAILNYNYPRNVQPQEISLSNLLQYKLAIVKIKF